MKFTFFKRLATLVFISAIALFQACTLDTEPVKVGASGFFIINEGDFTKGDTEISFFDRKTNSVTNNLFASNNGRPLGDQAQSMTVLENKGFIVVQNSSKVEVVNLDDFKAFASITGASSPRYFLGVSSTKGYVSDWGPDGVTGSVRVIDLSTYEVIKTIPTGKGANRMLKVNNLVYVANSGGYDRDNTVKVIDSNTDAVVASITVGDNPNSLARDKDGNIWVASTGYIDYLNDANSTKGSVSKITAGNTEALRLTVDKVIYNGPANLTSSTDGATLYYTFDNAIYAIQNTATTIPTAAFKAKKYYGVAVDPFNGNIIGCNAPNFSSAGTIDVYDSKGNLLNNYEVGTAPNGCAFK